MRARFDARRAGRAFPASDLPGRTSGTSRAPGPRVCSRISTRSPGRIANASISRAICDDLAATITARLPSRVITARGCPYHCNWCSHSVYGHTHRRRSPAAVADEVEWILERYSPDMLWMADDVFTIHHGWLEEYAAEMKRRGIRIPFECITRADRMNERVAGSAGANWAACACGSAPKAARSGFWMPCSAASRSSRSIRRFRSAEAHGIQTGMFLMWGYEGEEIADIEATVDHVKQCRPDVFFTTVSYPIKGTPLLRESRGSRLVPTGRLARNHGSRKQHSRPSLPATSIAMPTNCFAAKWRTVPMRRASTLRAAISS